MRHIIFSGVLLLACAIGGEAVAACDGSWTRVQGLISTLSGMTACSADGQGTQQEEHHTPSAGTGELWDYKCGDLGTPAIPHTVCKKPGLDPRRKLGMWTVQNDGMVDANGMPIATVTYNYTAFGNDVEGPFAVYTDGLPDPTYDFCNGSASVGTFKLKNTVSGTRVCGGPAPAP